MSFFTDILKEKYGKLRCPSESQFTEKGIIIPEEFIEAGDQLVSRCPTWQWKAAVDTKYQRSEFPLDKQYLSTRVPCRKRVNAIADTKTIEKDLGDGWFSAETEEESKPAGDESRNQPDMIPEKPDEEEVDGIRVKVSSSTKKGEDEETDDFIAVENPTGSETRYYELTITYDFYYLTPRLWLSGYTEDNSPLTDQEMFEDIVEDYAKKTVTYESHPYLGINQLGIHPCKHSHVMKHLIDVAKDNGVTIHPHQAMFIFLKFLSSVVPTMEYDFTIDVELS